MPEILADSRFERFFGLMLYVLYPQEPRALPPVLPISVHVPAPSLARAPRLPRHLTRPLRAVERRDSASRVGAIPAAYSRPRSPAESCPLRFSVPPTPSRKDPGPQIRLSRPPARTRAPSAASLAPPRCRRRALHCTRGIPARLVPLARCSDRSVERTPRTCGRRSHAHWRASRESEAHTRPPRLDVLRAGPIESDCAKSTLGAGRTWGGRWAQTLRRLLWEGKKSGTSVARQQRKPRAHNGPSIRGRLCACGMRMLYRNKGRESVPFCDVPVTYVSAEQRGDVWCGYASGAGTGCGKSRLRGRGTRWDHASIMEGTNGHSPSASDASLTLLRAAGDNDRVSHHSFARPVVILVPI
ncbi:hypothetical protein FB451DRAFT_1481063 [Mycena latifolia]|nr:hypothetical protein FB451DRAFT_1481063 [Mycena latifolia]